MLVLEGVRLVADALESGATLTLTLYAPDQLQLTPAGAALLQQLRRLPASYGRRRRWSLLRRIPFIRRVLWRWPRGPVLRLVNPDCCW